MTFAASPLPDRARVEAAVERARSQPLGCPISPRELSRCQRLSLAPHVQLLELDQDLSRCWPTGRGPNAARPDRHVVVFRFDGEVRVQAWPELSWRLLDALDRGQTMAEASETTLAHGIDRWTFRHVADEWLQIAAWRGLLEQAPVAC